MTDLEKFSIVLLGAKTVDLLDLSHPDWKKWGLHWEYCSPAKKRIRLSANHKVILFLLDYCQKNPWTPDQRRYIRRAIWNFRKALSE